MVKKSKSAILLMSTTVKDALTSPQVNVKTASKEFSQQSKYSMFVLGQTLVKIVPNNLVKLSQRREKNYVVNFRF